MNWARSLTTPRRYRSPRSGRAPEARSAFAERAAKDDHARPATGRRSGAQRAAAPAGPARRALGYTRRDRAHHGNVQGGLAARMAAALHCRPHRRQRLRHDDRIRVRPQRSRPMPPRQRSFASLRRSSRRAYWPIFRLACAMYSTRWPSAPPNSTTRYCYWTRSSRSPAPSATAMCAGPTALPLAGFSKYSSPVR